jgi:hypothetical protein
MTIPELLAAIEALMGAARSLGLYRTTEKLHVALNEARSEQYEVMPPPRPSAGITTEWIIGPVREQTP